MIKLATLYQVGFAYEAHIVDQAYVVREPGSVMRCQGQAHPQSVGAGDDDSNSVERSPVDPGCFEDA